MLQFARINRQNKVRQQQPSIYQRQVPNGNQTTTRSSTVECTPTCNIRCGSISMSTGIIMLLIGLQYSDVVLIIFGCIFCCVGFVFLFLNLDVFIRKFKTTFGTKKNVVVVQKKKDAGTEVQGQDSADVAVEGKSREAFLKPSLATHLYVITEFDDSPVFDRTIPFPN